MHSRKGAEGEGRRIIGGEVAAPQSPSDKHYGSEAPRVRDVIGKMRQKAARPCADLYTKALKNQINTIYIYNEGDIKSDKI
ncbi:MAG: hypothetical protein ACM3KR_11245 [Deltaproteobacteria bacterium]